MPKTRRSRNQPIFNPMPGDFAYTQDGDKVRVVERVRRDGVHVAVVRHQDKERQKLPDGGLASYKVRELTKDAPAGAKGESRGVAGQTRTKQPTFSVVNTVNTSLNNHYDFGVHAFGCADVAKAKLLRCDVYHHYEATAEEVVKAERDDLRYSGFGDAADNFTIKVFPCCKPPPQRSARKANSPNLQEDKKEAKTSLQNRRTRSKLRSAATTNPTSKEDHMAPAATRTRGRKRASQAETEEAPAAKKGRGKAKAAAAKPAANGNGGTRERRTHEDIVALVPEIVKHLRNGVTMTEIRLGGDTVGEGYGAGPVIRKALAEAGYNTKGEKVDVEDLTALKGKQLVNAVVRLREEGKAWYYIELATDMSQDDLKELLAENGYNELASGRVSVAGEDEEEAPAPRGRKRGAAKAQAEDDEAPARKRGRRRGRTNPSSED